MANLSSQKRLHYAMVVSLWNYIPWLQAQLSAIDKR